MGLTYWGRDHRLLALRLTSNVLSVAMKQEPGSEAARGPGAPEARRTASASASAAAGSDEENGQDIGIAPLSCSFCCRHLKSVNALRRHIASRHSEIQGREHECFICMKSFKTKWSLSTHNSRFHREMGCSSKGFTKIQYTDH